MSVTVSTITAGDSMKYPYGICVASLSPVLAFVGDRYGLCRSAPGVDGTLRVGRIAGVYCTIGRRC